MRRKYPQPDFGVRPVREADSPRMAFEAPPGQLQKLRELKRVLLSGRELEGGRRHPDLHLLLAHWDEHPRLHLEWFDQSSTEEDPLLP